MARMTVAEALAILDGKQPEKKQRKKPSHDEHKLQSECVEWFRWTYRNAFIYSIPNGGYRGSSDIVLRNGKTQAEAVVGKLKEEGMHNGVPDLHIPIPRHGFASLYIEMKTPKGRLSQDQETVISILEKCGNKVIVVRSFEQFVDVVTWYLGPAKELFSKSV